MKWLKTIIKKSLAKILAMTVLTVLFGLFAPTGIWLLSYFSGLDIEIISKLFNFSASGGILACLYHYFPSWDDFWDNKIKLDVGEQLVNQKPIENQNPLFHFSGQDNGEENPNQGGDQGSDMGYDSGISDVGEDYIPELAPLPIENRVPEVVDFESRPNPYTESGRPELSSSDLFDHPVINDDDSDSIKELKQQYIERLQERENDLEEILDSIQKREQDIASGNLSQKERSREARDIRGLQEEAREIGNTIPYDRDELNREVKTIMESTSNPNNIDSDSDSESDGS